MVKRRLFRSASADGDSSGPVVITEARQSYEEEHAARVRRYFLLMSVRIPALLLAGAAYMIWENGWVSLAIMAVSVPIPWIAVIGANDRPPLPKHKPRPYAGGSAAMFPDSYTLPAAVRGTASHDSATGSGVRPDQHTQTGFSGSSSSETQDWHVVDADSDQ